MIQVLIIDDHPTVRRGLKSLLADCSDIRVVAEAGNGAEALRAAQEHTLDILLLDIRMPGPDGIELAYQLRRAAPQAKIIILTAYDNPEYVVGALRAGAYAYLLKNSSDATLVETIRAVSQGKHFLSPDLIDRVMAQFQVLTQAHEPLEPNLPSDELKILDLMAKGATTEEIAQAMYCSERTAKRRVEDITVKLGARNRTQAVAEAIKHGLI